LQTDTRRAAPLVQGDNRRIDARHTPVVRAAVWFDLGSEIGDTCGLKDVSMSGFSIRCNEWQLPVFMGTEGKALYCVLLMGEAHFGCMAHMVNSPITHTGHVGFCFDALPTDSIRLLQGLIDCMAEREANMRGETSVRDLT
jgi:hypothetical protein